MQIPSGGFQTNQFYSFDESFHFLLAFYQPFQVSQKHCWKSSGLMECYSLFWYFCGFLLATLFHYSEHSDVFLFSHSGTIKMTYPQSSRKFRWSPQVFTKKINEIPVVKIENTCKAEHFSE